jgi:DNA-binding NarL/FixJ family response regulator
MKILFIDHKVLFTDGLESLLKSVGLNIEASYAKDVKSGLGKISTGIKPELIFVDVNLYVGNYKYLADELRELSTVAPIIIISEIESSSFENLMIEAGVSAFIYKTNNKKILFDAVKTVCEGNKYCDCHKLEHGYKKQNNDVVVTKRQYEILNLLAKGLLNKQIGFELGISINTVNAHIRNIYRCLHVKNRTAAVRSAQKNGLIKGLTNY